MPSCNNPIGFQISEERRHELAKIIKEMGLIVIEDDIHSFMTTYFQDKVLPPFQQLERGSYHLADNERNVHELSRWNGRLCQAGRIVGLERRGWQRLEESGSVYAMRKSTPYGALELETEPFSLIYGETGYSDLLPVESVKITAPYDRYGKQSSPTFSVLDDITASELINDIESLFD